MEFAFLDESGDLGSAGSRHVVLAILYVKSKKEVDQIIQDTKNRLLEQKKGMKFLARTGGEVKFYGFPDKVLLTRTLEKLSALKLQIEFIVFDKNGVDLGVDLKKTILSNLFKKIYEGVIIPTRTRIIADVDFLNRKKTNYFLLQRYSKTPLSSAAPACPNSMMYGPEIVFSELDPKDLPQVLRQPFSMVIQVDHVNSKSDICLQALDLICGSIFVSEENNDSTYLDILGTGSQLNELKFSLNPPSTEKVLQTSPTSQSLPQ